MLTNEKFMYRIANKALEPFGVTLEDLDKEKGLVKVGKKERYWWEVYTCTLEEHEVWKEWCIGEIRKHFPHLERQGKLMAAFHEMNAAVGLHTPIVAERKVEPGKQIQLF